MKKQTRLDVFKDDINDIFNELTKFMVNNKNRNSITTGEACKFFDCSQNKATRVLNGFVLDGRLTKDLYSDNLYWLRTE